MQKKTWVTLLVTGIAILVVTLLIGLVIGAPRQNQNDGPIGEVPDDIRTLIADPPKVDCVALATTYDLPIEDEKVVLTYIPNEVGTNNPAARDASNAVNISAIPAERDRVNASICTQPEEAGMVGVGLANNQMVGNQRMTDLNPDLFGQFVGITVKEWADKVFSGEISYADATETMAQLAGIMTIAEVTTESRTTDWNYEALAQISTKADVREIVLNNQQYTGDFLVYTLSQKKRKGCWGTWGINIGVGGDITKGDQRLAGFICKEPPTRQGPTPTPTPDDGCVTPECLKNPALDVLNNPDLPEALTTDEQILTADESQKQADAAKEAEARRLQADADERARQAEAARLAEEQRKAAEAAALAEAAKNQPSAPPLPADW